MARQCNGTTNGGRACKRPPSRDSDYCLAHDPSPETRERHAEITASGGRARWSERVAAFQAEIRDLQREIRAGEIDAQKANFLLQSYRLLRELEADGRHAAELDDLADEVRQLRETLEAS